MAKKKAKKKITKQPELDIDITGLTIAEREELVDKLCESLDYPGEPEKKIQKRIPDKELKILAKRLTKATNTVNIKDKTKVTGTVIIEVETGINDEGTEIIIESMKTELNAVDPKLDFLCYTDDEIYPEHSEEKILRSRCKKIDTEMKKKETELKSIRAEVIKVAKKYDIDSEMLFEHLLYNYM